MNTKFASLLLSSACAVGICGVAMAQNMSGAQSAQQPPAMQQTPVAPQNGQMPQPAGGNDQALPSDQEATVSGVQVMCGGIGSDEADPRYANYPAKIEVAGGYGQWLGDNQIVISGDGQNITAQCKGPWFMAQLQPGRYTVSVTHGATSHTARLSVAANGQHKIVVRFPELQKGKDDGTGPYTGQQMGPGTSSQ
jgi:hypothetical protein